MPCRYYTEGEEKAMAQDAAAKLRTELDRLTHENDQLRELVIDAVKHGKRLTLHKEDLANRIVPSKLWRSITKDQVEHRKEDLDRCEKTLRGALRSFGQQTADTTHWIIADSKVAAATPSLLLNVTYSEMQRMLGAVITADPTQPLEHQLGFDPDSI